MTASKFAVLNNFDFRNKYDSQNMNNILSSYLLDNSCN